MDGKLILVGPLAIVSFRSALAHIGEIKRRRTSESRSLDAFFDFLRKMVREEEALFIEAVDNCVGSASVGSEKTHRRDPPCRARARESIINIFMNASIFVRSYLEGNVQFHRCTTVITENSTSARRPPQEFPSFHRGRLVRTSISLLLSTSLLATPNQFSHTNSARRSRSDDVASV